MSQTDAAAILGTHQRLDNVHQHNVVRNSVRSYQFDDYSTGGLTARHSTRRACSIITGSQLSPDIHRDLSLRRLTMLRNVLPQQTVTRILIYYRQKSC